MCSFRCGTWCQPVSSQLAPISLSFEVCLKLGCQLFPGCPRLLVCFSICQFKCPWVVNSVPSSSAPQLGICEEETLHCYTLLWGSKPSWILRTSPEDMSLGLEMATDWGHPVCQGGGLPAILAVFSHPQTSQDGKFGQRGSGRRRKNFHSHSETISVNILVW